MVKTDMQVKFKVKDVEDFFGMLRKENFILCNANFEKTIKYDFEDEHLSQQGIFIRTKSGFDNTLTIKEKNISKAKKYFERGNKTFEIEDCKYMDYLFKKIGLTNTRIMEKYRITWKKGKIEMHVDELPFGVFGEICSSEKKIDATLKKIKINEI